MARTEGYTGPTDLVYQVYQGQVIFADRETALYVAQLWDALNSRTWAEFRAKLPRGGLDDFLEHFADEYDDDNYPVDDFPTGDEPFGPYFVDGYPEWLAQSMLTWSPNDFIEEYRESAVGSDGYIPAKGYEVIADGLRNRGCTVEPSPVFLI